MAARAANPNHENSLASLKKTPPAFTASIAGPMIPVARVPIFPMTLTNPTSPEIPGIPSKNPNNPFPFPVLSFFFSVLSAIDCNMPFVSSSLLCFSSSDSLDLPRILSKDAWIGSVILDNVPRIVDPIVDANPEIASFNPANKLVPMIIESLARVLIIVFPLPRASFALTYASCTFTSLTTSPLGSTVVLTFFLFPKNPFTISISLAHGLCF